MDNETLSNSRLNASKNDIGIRSSIEICKSADFLPTEVFGSVATCMRNKFDILPEVHVGWFDCLLTSERFSESEYLVIRDLDLLGKIGLELGYVNLCTIYKCGDTYIHKYSEDVLKSCEIIEPNYITIQGGWKIPRNIRDFSRLPSSAKGFIRLIEVFVGKPVKLIGVGPLLEDVVYKD